ncbi:hypothetical protein INR49_002515 [Caranx melampygus]|nr:hypothetical protein INR49_002515 [Caranx melampygus]
MNWFISFSVLKEVLGSEEDRSLLEIHHSHAYLGTSQAPRELLVSKITQQLVSQLWVQSNGAQQDSRRYYDLAA